MLRLSPWSLGRRSRPTNCPFKRTSFGELPRAVTVRLPDTAGPCWSARTRPPEVLIGDTNCSRSPVEDVEIAGNRRRQATAL